MIKLALTKGRIEKNTEKLLRNIGYDTTPMIKKDRKLLVNLGENLQIIFVKSDDVIQLVDKGIMDIGIVGSDTMFENQLEGYSQVLDLGTGRCYFALCGFPSYNKLSADYKKRIATKYPNIAKKYFDKKKEEVELIKLGGSVEIGPIIGLTDAIVDIVETGETLRANGLEVLDVIGGVSTRLIGNNERMRNMDQELFEFINKIENYKLSKNNYNELECNSR